MAGGTATPHGVVVHRRQVGVDERVGVDDLDGSGRRIETLRSGAEGVAGRVHEYRPEALAATEDGVAHGTVQVLRRLVGGRQHAREHGVGARAPGDHFGRQLRGWASRGEELVRLKAYLA
jgi:hypothetical protein